MREPVTTTSEIFSESAARASIDAIVVKALMSNARRTALRTE